MAVLGRTNILISSLVILLTLSTNAAARRFTKDKDAVRLENVRALTFYKDRETAHRRVPALPQLSCTSGSGCSYFEPDSVRCVNSGSSYDASSIEWTCTASLPPEFKLGSTDVVCEGYDSPSDDYVLKGSCALEYRLLLTDLGSEKFGSQPGKSGSGAVNDSNSFWVAAVFWLIFAAVAGWIIYSLLRGVFRRGEFRGAPRGPQRRWGGGDWDDDDDDPPPPYTPYRDDPLGSRPSKPRVYKARSSQAGSSRAESSRSAANRNQQNGQRPWWQSFGAGAAAGSAAGYYAANARNNQRERNLREREQYLDMREQQGQRPTWLNTMFGGPGNRNPQQNQGPIRGSFAGSPRSFTAGGGSRNSVPSVSSERYESSGFGGTRRR